MRDRLAVLLLVPACCLLSSCGARIIVHDERVAARSAAKFADLAFIRSDYSGAHAMLVSQMRQSLSVDKLAAEIAKMHPKARPSEVTTTEFEPLPGQRAMNIYLKGAEGDETFYYRLLMVGDKGSGYMVGGIWRGSGPYPPSARNPL